MQKYLQEVEREIKKLATQTYKASNDRFAIPRSLGVSNPKQRKLLKKGFSFSRLPDAQQWKIWDYIIKNSKLHEAQMAAIRFAEERVTRPQPVAAGFPAHRSFSEGGSLRLKRTLKGSATKPNDMLAWRYVRNWSNHIDNWGHSDVLSKVYSFLHERHPEHIYPTLKKWNKSKRMWHRRISIVSLIYYASKNRKAPPLSKVMPLVENLIHDDHHYIQKAVGWTLRECYNLYPQKTYAFLNKHIKQLPAITFSYSTEKLSKTEKEKLKTKRKK
ncbi:MAG: DNA alkylation repair protein [Patescibacteria group bacterium]